jgi:hypothetical protein
MLSTVVGDNTMQEMWLPLRRKQDYVALIIAASVGDGFAVAGVTEGPDLAGSEMS